jgi:hypothetical protein
MPKKIPVNDLDERRPGTWAEWQRYEKRCAYLEMVVWGKAHKDAIIPVEEQIIDQCRRRADRLKVPYGYRDWPQFESDAQLWKEGFLS